MKQSHSDQLIPNLTKHKELTLRILYLFSSGFLFYEGFQNWLRGKLESHPEVVILCIVTYVLALVLLTASLLSAGLVRRLRVLPLIALLFVAASSIYVIAEIQYKGVYRTDSMAFTHYASELWLFPSWNPYGSDLQEALEIFAVDIDYVTLKPNGDLVTNLNYPALHLLLYTPFTYLGFNDMRWVTFIFEVATIVFLYWKSPEELRPLILIPLFAGSDLAINFTAGCLGDFLWAFPLTVTVFHLGSPLIAGVTYGLASAVKQEPWILLPFLLTWIWMSSERNKRIQVTTVVIFLASAASAFLLPNIFFILKNHRAWFADVTTPLSGDLIVIGQGLSTLTQKGLVPLPRSFYLTLAVAVFVLLLIGYNLYFTDLKHTLWALPGVIMWVSPRGLQNYFVYLIPICLAAIIVLYRERKEVDSC